MAAPSLAEVNRYPLLRTVEIKSDWGLAASSFFRKPGDQHINRAIERIGAAPARPVEDLVAGEHASRPLHETRQQIELRACQHQD